MEIELAGLTAGDPLPHPNVTPPGLAALRGDSSVLPSSACAPASVRISLAGKQRMPLCCGANWAGGTLVTLVAAGILHDASSQLLHVVVRFGACCCRPGVLSDGTGGSGVRGPGAVRPGKCWHLACSAAQPSPQGRDVPLTCLTFRPPEPAGSDALHPYAAHVVLSKSGALCHTAPSTLADLPSPLFPLSSPTPHSPFLTALPHCTLRALPSPPPQVFKANLWGQPVAVKISRLGAVHAGRLLREVEFMRSCCSPHVLQVGSTNSSTAAASNGWGRRVWAGGSSQAGGARDCLSQIRLATQHPGAAPSMRCPFVPSGMHAWPRAGRLMCLGLLPRAAD